MYVPDDQEQTHATKNLQQSQINIYLPEYPTEKECLTVENLRYQRKLSKGKDTGFHGKKL